LVRRLGQAHERRVVLVEAPAGYGKTTLVSEWLASDGEHRPGAWLSLDPADREPQRLLARLQEALDRAARGRAAVGGGPTSLEGLLQDLTLRPEPLVLVLDDYQVLQGPAVHELMGRVVAGLPVDVQLVVVTRATPRLPIGSLRAAGSLFELRTPDLCFDEDDAAALLGQCLGIDGRAVARCLVERTEGWPAGLQLAMRSLREERDPASFAAGFCGTHRHVVDYLVEEVLRDHSPAVRAFLAQTSILGRMCGRLCDAVVDGGGSQALLEELERSNAFVVPLDEERRWYRYHRLFGEMLRAELDRSPPAEVADLHCRASAWFDAEGDYEAAAGHALAALRLAPPRQRRVPSRPASAVPGAGPVPPVVEVPLEFGQSLTSREMTILRLLPSDLCQREIARELFVSLNTVKTHSRAIYRKLGVSGRRAAVDRARELDLLDGSPGPVGSVGSAVS
jgi:LuxR family maltose regulon positive regulatory protein